MTYFIFPGMKKRDRFVKTILYRDKDCIINTVLMHFGLTFSQLIQRYRGREISYPRMVCMYMMSKNTRIGSVGIGKIFGYHHTTVLNAIRTIQDIMDTDDSVRSQVLLIGEEFNNYRT